MKPTALTALIAVALAVITVSPTSGAILTRAFSSSETSQFVTAGNEGGGWFGNTLTLLDGPSSTERIAGFIPDDAVGIYFEFSTTQSEEANGADVVLIRDQVDGNTVSDILADVATKRAGEPWYASIAGPAIPQRVDVLPQTENNGVTTVHFFFAPETLIEQSAPNVFDRVMFTTGHRDAPESFTYANVSWILAGSTGNTRSPGDNTDAIVPEPASLAIWGSVGLIGLVAWMRRRGTKAASYSVLGAALSRGS